MRPDFLNKADDSLRADDHLGVGFLEFGLIWLRGWRFFFLKRGASLFLFFFKKKNVSLPSPGKKNP